MPSRIDLIFVWSLKNLEPGRLNDFIFREQVHLGFQGLNRMEHVSIQLNRPEKQSVLMSIMDIPPSTPLVYMVVEHLRR